MSFVLEGRGVGGFIFLARRVFELIKGTWIFLLDACCCWALGFYKEFALVRTERTAFGLQIWAWPT